MNFLKIGNDEFYDYYKNENVIEINENELKSYNKVLSDKKNLNVQIESFSFEVKKKSIIKIMNLSKSEIFEHLLFIYYKNKPFKNYNDMVNNNHLKNQKFIEINTNIIPNLNLYLKNNNTENNFMNNNKNKVNSGLYSNYNSFNGNKVQNNSRNKKVTTLLKPFSSYLTNENNGNNGNNNNNGSTMNYLNKINKFLNKNTKKINSNPKITIQTQLSNSNHKTSDFDSLEKYSYIYIDHLLKQYNFDTKRITEKEFNIFELKKIVGQSNVLPLMGRVILETFGLKNDKIINVNKLDTFLYAVNSQYLNTTLYHNNMHGADVTQTISLFFLNSNAEKMFQTTVMDLLSIFIAALGHDIGHPGLTNNFHVNASTELAITYNDSSCLENFHCCKLFTIIKKDETNIFEKLSVENYKKIRKRMISQILATDMANHGEVISLIRTKIKPFEEDDKQIKDPKNNFVLLSGNEKTKFDEQQILFNYLIHCADLGHNCKKYEISKKWVKELCEEFWSQGDKEKSLGIPVSFLCDREKIDVPSSQVGFLRGLILTTFDSLVEIFPNLKFTMNNAKRNISLWQKLVEQKRATGWTPKKEKNKEKGKDKVKK